jgi:N-acyl homoserine lactone hydrolase
VTPRSALPTVEPLLAGQRLRTTVGSVAFCGLTLITGGHRVLIDVGHVGRRMPLLAALDARGLSPRDIDVLVLTHVHWDHAQNLDLFLHAPLLVHPLERRYVRRPHPNDWATPSWSHAMLEHHPNIIEVDEGHVIEPGVSIMHTPGHTPGSISVVVDGPEGCTVVAGDAIHFPSAALTGRNPLVFWDREQADASIARVVATADVIYPGHDRPFRLTRNREDFEYLVPLDLELLGHRGDEPGLRWQNVTRSPWVMPGIEQQRLDDLPSG